MLHVYISLKLLKRLFVFIIFVSFILDVWGESGDAGNGSAYLSRLSSWSLETRYRGKHHIETYQVCIALNIFYIFSVILFPFLFISHYLIISILKFFDICVIVSCYLFPCTIQRKKLKLRVIVNCQALNTLCYIIIVSHTKRQSIVFQFEIVLV